NTENPSDRTLGSPTEQLLENNQQGTISAITTVQKDNLLVENIIIGSTQKNTAINKDGITPTLTSAMGQGGGHVPMHNYTPNFKVRKLTPLECWRLMGIADEDFKKASKVVSNTQLYKQAGNAIVVDVLEGIFKQMF
ncbi:MAG: DNA cytosine methyltransferase, partial [Neofamilia sp.]